MMFPTRRNYLVSLLCLVSVGCSDSEEEASIAQIRPAKLVTVEAASSQRDLTFPAVVRALKSTELTFQVNGEIKELNVIGGIEIEQGTVIARLDQRDAQNSLARAQAEYENAESEYNRAAQLIDRGGISRSDLDDRRTQRDIARVSLNTAEKALSDTVLKAPFSGAVSQVYVEQFQNIQAKEPILVLQSEKVEALVNIPGTIVARAPQFEPINTRVILDAAPELEIAAEFHESSGQADPNTQTYEISFTFDPPEDLLILPGMTATLKTTLVLTGVKDLAPEGIAVPIASILAEGDQNYVWVVNKATMAVAKQPVTVSPDAGDMVRVTQGLKGGETIVAAGVSFFHEGTLVRPWVAE